MQSTLNLERRPGQNSRLNLCSMARRCPCFPSLLREAKQFDDWQTFGINWLSDCVPLSHYWPVSNE